MTNAKDIVGLFEASEDNIRKMLSNALTVEIKDAKDILYQPKMKGGKVVSIALDWRGELDAVIDKYWVKDYKTTFEEVLFYLEKNNGTQQQRRRKAYKSSPVYMD